MSANQVTVKEKKLVTSLREKAGFSNNPGEKPVVLLDEKGNLGQKPAGLVDEKARTKFFNGVPSSSVVSTSSNAAEEETFSSKYVLFRRQYELLRKVRFDTKRSASEIVREALDEWFLKSGIDPKSAQFSSKNGAI